MSSPIHKLWLLLAIVGTAVLTQAAQAQAPDLGEPPTAPTDLSGLPTGVSRQSVTSGFNVNASQREEVRSFYNAVFLSSANVPMNSSTIVSNCFAGTNGTAFNEATLRRINWFRAMAGVPSLVTLNTTENTKDQQAALMMAANNSLSHYPPNTWSCWSSGGTNAAANSNLSLGSAGPDAIVGYIVDYGAGNNFIGHRRWILYPQTTVMGSGDAPAQGGLSAANATWVIDGNYGGARPGTRTLYVAWPPSGYVPYQLVYPRWSFGYASANFTSATVTMTSNGVPVSVVKETYATGYGENTVVWVPMGLDATDYNAHFPFSGTDTVYTVTVTNISGMPQTGYTYTVTLFDPAKPGSDYKPPTISGTVSPQLNLTNSYSFTPITNATSYQWRISQPIAGNLSDGAETGAGNFVANVSSGYSTITNIAATGASSFHLQHTSAADQTFLLNRVLFVRTNTQFSFKSRIGYATTSEVARVEAAVGDSLQWETLYSQVGSGGSGEASFTLRTLSLTNYAGKPLRLRFNYHYEPYGSYYNTGSPVGWYFDDVLLTNCQQLINFTTNSVSSTNFTFIPLLATNYNLEARALIFTEFPLDWGPTREISAVLPSFSILTLSKPSLSNTTVRLDFSLQGATPSTFKLLEAPQIKGPWTTNNTASLTTNVLGSSYRYTTTVNGAARYYRLQTP